jgi:ABC-type branched-subunit amino acid transport system substrate-binding protein
VNGVTADKIVIGNSSGYETGRAIVVSLSVVNGIRAYIQHLNEDLGGIHGRRIELDLQDNGYDGADAKSDTEDMTNPDANGSRKVFAIVGNAGTPPVEAALPVALENKTILFAPVTGAAFLRPTNPPIRYVFNYRVSDAEQTAAGSDWMVNRRMAGKVRPRNVAAFAQGLSDGGQDGCTWDDAGAITCPADEDSDNYESRKAELDEFGVEGYNGVVNYLNGTHGIPINEVTFASHDRTKLNVKAAVGRFLHWLGRAKVGGGGEDFDAGIVLQVVTDPAVLMVTDLRDVIANVKTGTPPAGDYGTFTAEELAEIKHVKSVTFVGTLIGGAFVQSLADAANDSRYCSDVLAMQVVPFPESTTKLALEYRDALKAYKEALQPDVFSFEGYISMKLFVAGLQKLGKDITTEALVDTFESMHQIDIGGGADLGFSDEDHQASQDNWAQMLSAGDCQFVDFPEL